MQTLRFVSLLSIFVSAMLLQACPFCAAVSQTLRQEIASMDAAVIGEALPAQEGDSKEEGQIRLKVVKVLKGEELVKPGLEIEAVYFGKVEPGRRFMLTGVDPPNLMWSSPLSVVERSEKYLEEILALPDDSLKRLQFYQKFLEHEDPMLARDAYDEFAVAPYKEVIELGPYMDREQLLTWIQDAEVASDRKRLYLTMLGICGVDKDVELLEGLLTSTQPSTRAGLDALIACYLTLKGPSGLEKIDTLFLGDKSTEYADTYAAIQALRFHGTETDKIPRERLVQSLRLILNRKDLADLVIPDLARWEDWSLVEKMVELFESADPSNNWVRVPVVNYLRACPKPEAKEAIEHLEKIDPASVRRAKTFFPVPAPGPAAKPATSAVPRLGDTLASNATFQNERSDSSTLPNPANLFQLLSVFASAGTSLGIVYWLVLVS